MEDLTDMPGFVDLNKMPWQLVEKGLKQKVYTGSKNCTLYFRSLEAGYTGGEENCGSELSLILMHGQCELRLGDEVKTVSADFDIEGAMFYATLPAGTKYSLSNLGDTDCLLLIVESASGLSDTQAVDEQAIKSLDWGKCDWFHPKPEVKRKVYQGSRFCTISMGIIGSRHVPVPHAHDYEQICLIVKGKCDFHVGDRNLLCQGDARAEAGVVCFTVPPGEEHWIHNHYDADAYDMDIFFPKRTGDRQESVEIRR